MINKIHNEDCLELLKKIPDNSIDLIVTDPPYIINSCGSGGAFGNREYLQELRHKATAFRCGFDFELLKEFDRVQKKRNIYIFCNKNLLAELLSYYKDGYFDILVYHKKNPTPLCNNKYLSDLEYILFAREKGVKVDGSYATKSKLFSLKVEKNNYGHPTVKPLEIVRTLISNSSKQGDTVLDAFIGSGTTAVACKALDRNYIGCEISSEYCNIANKRLERFQKTLDFEKVAQ